MLRAALGLIALGTVFHLAYSTHLELVGNEDTTGSGRAIPTSATSTRTDDRLADPGGDCRFLVRRFSGCVFLPCSSLAARESRCFCLPGFFFRPRCLLGHRGCGRRPLFAVGASLMTIDTVYVFLWALGGPRFLARERSDASGPWILTGALVRAVSALEIHCGSRVDLFRRFLPVGSTEQSASPTGDVLVDGRDGTPFSLPGDHLEPAASLADRRLAAASWRIR